MKQFVKVARIGEPMAVRMKLVEAEGERVLLARVDGQYYAVSEVCTHRGCPLSEGALEGKIVQCPCHGSRFDVTTGEVVGGPAARPVARYGVKIDGQDILIGPG